MMITVVMVIEMVIVMEVLKLRMNRSDAVANVAHTLLSCAFRAEARECELATRALIMLSILALCWWVWLLRVAVVLSPWVTVAVITFTNEDAVWTLQRFDKFSYFWSVSVAIAIPVVIILTPFVI